MAFKSLPLFVLPLAAVATTAQAADIAQVAIQAPPAPVFDDRWHAHIEGGPVFSSTHITSDPADKFANVGDRGFYVGAVLRHMFRPGWSWQIGATATWMREHEFPASDALLISNLAFQTYDVDVGLHPTNDLHQRLFVGLRVLHSEDSLHLFIPFDESLSTGAMWLFGPRGGVSWEMPLGSPTFAFLTEFSASALFGNANVVFDAPFSPVDMSGPRTVLNAEAQVGFLWRPSTNFELAFGYRAQEWWGLLQGTEVNTFAVDAFVDPDKFIHGPFARVGIDF